MKKVFLFCLLFLLSLSVFSQLSLIDDLGRLITFESTPKRIISAAPAVSDYLVFLNVENSVVGVTDWDSHIFTAEKIGNMVPLNIEKIISLNPDLVFLTGGFQEPEVEKLEKFGIKTFVINPVSYNDIYRSITVIGAILGNQKEAQKLSTELRQKVTKIGSDASRRTNTPNVFYAMISTQNLAQIWTAGTGSFINDTISIAGGANIAAPYTGNNGWLAVGPEFIVSKNPEVIIIPSYYGDESGKEALLNSPLFKDINAVKNKNIILIDENSSSQASPSLISVLEQLFEEFGKIK
jgi:iron complex transport system substrate-binding protein